MEPVALDDVDHLETISFLDTMMEVLKHFEGETIHDIAKKLHEVQDEDTKNLLKCTIYFSFWTLTKKKNKEDLAKIFQENMIYYWEAFMGH